jgi:hypothetical protein
VARLVNQNFNSQGIGEPPTGWTLSDTDAAAIANDPETPGSGRVCEIYDTHGGTVYARVPFASIASGVARLKFKWRIDALPNGIEYFNVCVLPTGWAGEGAAAIRIRNDTGTGKAYYLSAASEVLIGVVLVDTWYTWEIVCHVATSTYDLYKDAAMVASSVAYGDTAADIRGLHFNQPDNKLSYVDDVIVSALDDVGATPDRCTLATAFEGDDATATSYKPDGTTPNRSSSYCDADQTLTNSLNRYWETDDASDGIHRATYDLGSAQTIDILALINHNMGVIVGTGSPNVSVTLQAVSALDPPYTWVAPDFEVDITDQIGNDPIVVFLPASTTYRYWSLAIRCDNVSYPTYWRIGRVILTSAFTPEHSFSEPYEVARVDPSILAETEGGAPVGRAKTPYRSVSFGWGANNPLTIDDQDDLDDMLVAGAGGKAWLAILDPENRLEKMTIYGTMKQSHEFKRTVLDQGMIEFEIREIVT